MIQAVRFGGRWSVNAGGGGSTTSRGTAAICRLGSSFLREAGILRALSAEHASSGVRTARFLGALPDARALVGGFVPGEADFRQATNDTDRAAVAADFMGQLARLHAIDVAVTPVPELGPLLPPSVVVRGHIAKLRASTLETGRDPLILLTLDWLDANVPPDPARTVIVHCDGGPGNFLYADRGVMALLDWKLLYYGDAMADLMICLRTLIQPCVPLPQAFADYEAAGGVPVDLDRVRFYRIYFQARFARSASRLFDASVPPPPVIGTSILYGMLHLRVLGEALAEASGVILGPVGFLDAPPGVRERFFDVALDDLKDAIVPRLDQQAAAKAKGLARLVKWRKRSERYAAAYEAVEIAEIGQALGSAHADLAEARCVHAGNPRSPHRSGAGAGALPPAHRARHRSAERFNGRLYEPALCANRVAMFATKKLPRQERIA